MNFLAIDTGGKYLSVVSCRNGETFCSYQPNCFAKHSVVLMDEIKRALSRAELRPEDCDFFAVVVGPGSFTGIRIGVSTVKGLCFACDKPALALTSFDCLAYAEKSEPLLALVDAGHGYYYACAYDQDKTVAAPPAYCSKEETEAIIGRGFTPIAADRLFEGCAVVDPCKGLTEAVKAKHGELVSASGLAAVYLRKSSAEENRK